MDWSKVAETLDSFARDASDLQDGLLDMGQRATVAELARRIRAGQRAALLADEVGMGKTRIAVALIEAVRRAGGRSAIVLPAGLGAQWQQELRRFNPNDKTLLPLRSYDGFIDGFITEADIQGRRQNREAHIGRLKDRRIQRDLPQKFWRDEKILMISHTFANITFQDRGKLNWRRELVPAVRYELSGERRNEYDRGSIAKVRATHRAAETIAATIKKHSLNVALPRNHLALPPRDYHRNLLPLIGYSLGRFDLIVIDEAHKARGTNSGLSRALGPITWESPDPFRLGMTATPVELDASQWIDTLGRISGRDDGKDLAGLGDLQEWITGYVGNVQRLQIEELDDPLTQNFEDAANRFRKGLQPYVLRRDKRHDPEFRAFQDRHGDYRQITDIPVTPDKQGFTHDWLRRFCAAEALSLLPQDDPRIKRARLSVAQGYGFGMMTDAEAQEQIATPVEQGPHSVWLDAFTRIPADLYSHPALLATVRKIESYTENGEKVLVFGRFIKPMQALTRLLDAREMLRRLRDKQHWPARSVGKGKDSIPAVRAAALDPDLKSPAGGIDEINRLLNARYYEWSSARSTELERLHREIETLAQDDETASMLVHFLKRDGDEIHVDIAALLELLDARRSDPAAPWTGAEMLDLFRALLSELAGEDDDKTPAILQSRLATHLADYSGREGNFARMMSGNTAPQTRRLLQAAFNRPASWPKVLVAQSLVGREGLNLHEACRTVVLLHSEWNPGIVEQQIGRVDRKNSLWLRDMRRWLDSGSSDAPPRIRIHPVVVSGTYDDHNWQVLKSRWLELRAQLHGDVLPHLARGAAHSPEKQGLIDRIHRATPNFAPPGLDGNSDTCSNIF